MQSMQKPRRKHSGGVLRHLKPKSPGLLLGLVTLISASLMVILTPSARGKEAGYTFRAMAYLGNPPDTPPGSPAPGGGVFVNDFEPTRLNNRGQLAFTAEPVVPGKEGIFLAGDTTLKQIMRFGQPAPGTGTTFSTLELGNIGLNDAGDVAFAFTLEPYQVDPFVRGGLYRYSHITQTPSPVVIPGGTSTLEGVTLLGAGFNVSLNNKGTLAFNAFFDTVDGPKQGVFVADKRGSITTVAQHGTTVPDVGTFAYACCPWINDQGDVTFGAATDAVDAVNAIYVKRAATGKIEAIPSPPGYHGAITPAVINNRGDVALGLIADPSVVGSGAVYLWTHNSLVRVAGVGDPAPISGHISQISAAINAGQLGLNNSGAVVFAVETDSSDQAILLYSHGSFRVVAHIGEEIPGVGRIHSLEQFGVLIFPPPPVGSGFLLPFTTLNDSGQVAFVAILEDGRGVLLLASPNEQ